VSATAAFIRQLLSACPTLSAASVVLVFLAPVLLTSSQAAAQGWKRESEEQYRAFIQQPTYRAFLPPAVDLSRRFPRPGDQGKQGSCTAWAVGYALRSYHEGVRQGWDLDNPAHQVSPAHIYNRLVEDQRSCEGGTAISDALKLLKSAGAVDFASLPYSPTDCASLPKASMPIATEQWRIADWRSLNMARPDNIKGELAKGNPVVFGMDMSKSLLDLRGEIIYDDIESPRDGGHAMVVVGYNDALQAFKVMNSWGVRWGKDGFGWVSYRAMTALSDRGFVISIPKARVPDIREDVKPFTPAPKPPVEVPAVVAVTPPPISNDPPPVVVPVTPPSPLPAPPVNAPVIAADTPAIVPVAPPSPPTPLPLPPVDAPVVAADKPPVPPVETPVVANITPAPPQPVTPPAITDPVVAPIIAPLEPPSPPVVVAVVPKPEPPLTPTALRARVEKEISEFACANVTITPRKGAIGSLSGFVGAVQDRDKLAALLGKDAEHLTANLAVRPWPQCEALSTFSTALSKPRGLDVKIAGDQAPTLLGGAKMVVEITTPDYPTYLYVTYLQASGNAVHLTQPDRPLARALPPNTKVTLGADNLGPTFRVGPPFGTEMIVAIATASPLFSTSRPPTEIERDYLTAFRLAFLEKPKPGMLPRVVAAAATTLTTQAP